MDNNQHHDLDCSTSHDCIKVLSKVFLALDGSLTPEEEAEFLEELNRCPYCLDQFKIEKSFKEFLCSKVKNHQIPKGMVENIRAKIKELAVN